VLTRRDVIGAAGVALVAGAVRSHAQGFNPERPIRIAVAPLRQSEHMDGIGKVWEQALEGAPGIGDPVQKQDGYPARVSLLDIRKPDPVGQFDGSDSWCHGSGLLQEGGRALVVREWKHRARRDEGGTESCNYEWLNEGRGCEHWNLSVWVDGVVQRPLLVAATAVASIVMPVATGASETSRKRNISARRREAPW
jgi:hypothetical protein